MIHHAIYHRAQLTPRAQRGLLMEHFAKNICVAAVTAKKEPEVPSSNALLNTVMRDLRFIKYYFWSELILSYRFGVKHSELGSRIYYFLKVGSRHTIGHGIIPHYKDKKMINTASLDSRGWLAIR